MVGRGRINYKVKYAIDFWKTIHRNTQQYQHTVIKEN